MEEIIRQVETFFTEQFAVIRYNISNMTGMQIFINVLDIVLMTMLFFAVFRFINNRRAGKLALGLVVLIVIAFISSVSGMRGMQFILSNFYQVGILAILIVFQPELRAALEKVGGTTLKSGIKGIAAIEAKDLTAVSNATQAISDAVVELSKTKTGAIIVIENSTRLGEYIKSERVIDAQITSELLQNIFYKNSPLHDGAVIIRGLRIYAAGCFLPLPSNDETVGSLGSRHRAGVGISEHSDALAIIVSEQTGAISVAFEGELTRNYDKETLDDLMFNFMSDKNIKGHLKKKKKNSNPANPISRNRNK